jgi:uncharacterized membrane protein
MSATPSQMPPPDEPAAGLNLVLPGRHCDAGAGWTWVAEGWRLFKRAPLMWIIALLLVIVAAILLGLVPIVGSLVFQALNGVIAAGFMVACRSLEQGGEFELEHLFAGFKARFPALLAVGLLVMAGWIVILLVFAAFVGFSILGAVLTGNIASVTAAVLASMASILLGILVATALSVPLMAAFWFAPALVALHGLAPLAAMRASFVACFANFVPFLVYGIVMLFFAILAAIPFGLGYLVWIPLAISSTYAAYRAIFTEDAPAVDAAVVPAPAAA